MAAYASIEKLRAALPELAAQARSRSDEFERLRRLAPDFVDGLKRAGLFKIVVPADAGGSGGSLNDLLDISTALAEADASTGWVCAHGNICAGIIHASAEPRLRSEFFAEPGAYASWSNLPRVKAKEQDDGLRISGSWGFESGCTAATYVGGMVMLPPLGDKAPPRMVTALAPVAQARIEETWDPVGLAGTGSHDVHFDDLLVPWHRVFPWPAGIATAPFPTAAFVPGGWFITIAAAATHLGLARRALDEARNELRGKVNRLTQAPLLEHPATQRNLEAAEGLWFACRAGLREALGAVWQRALRGEPATQAERLDARVAGTTAVHQCAQIVRTAYDAAGASAVHRAGVLQRLLREASCLTHHISANQGSYEVTGRVRCGIDPLSFRV